MTHWNIDTALTTRYLSEMVAIDSVNPDLVPGGAGEGAVAQWLLRTCAALGLDVETQDTAPGRPNVIATWKGSGGGKSLLLTGHTDVVGTENMEIAPFSPEIREGRLYGRGSFDMKGGLAAILSAVAALKTGGFQPAGDIILGFVTDEEYASIGTAALIEKVKADAAILTEPTDLQIGLAHRGFAWITITVEGYAMHGSAFMIGVDAIRKMRHVLNSIDKMETERFPERTHPLLLRPSVHASLIEGGLGWSTYPDRCTLRIEHRLLPDESGADMVRLWEDELAKIREIDPEFRAHVQLELERPGLEVDPDAPIVRALTAAYRQLMGEAPVYYGSLAWLDSALLARAGIPTVILGPGGEGAHAAVEYVDLDSVFKCAALIARTAADWTGR